jgi:tRNA (guanine-N7-)-methyltransferase
LGRIGHDRLFTSARVGGKILADRTPGRASIAGNTLRRPAAARAESEPDARTAVVCDSAVIGHCDNGCVNPSTSTVDDCSQLAPPETAADARRGSRLYPRVTSFRARRGAISPARQQAWERTWPLVGRDVTDERIDAAAWFGRRAPVVLEIGCGTGTATAAMAQAEPQVNLIGVEVYRPGLAQLVQRMEREAIANIRLVRGDAVDVLANMIAPGSLAGVRVFFPDPWPKARHHKRRLLQPATVALIADRLIDGGVLHVATDHAPYAEFIAQSGDGEPLLRRVAAGTAPVSCVRPVTKFEDKAHRAGSDITELLWGKITV